MSYDQVNITRTHDEPMVAPRAISQSPGSLEELAKAASRYAAAADVFITARYDLNDARDQYQACLDVVAKHREQENV